MAKPVIITLDDDPQVLRTIVQDLRNKYGAKFRVISSDSSEKILETLEALKNVKNL